MKNIFENVIRETQECGEEREKRERIERYENDSRFFEIGFFRLLRFLLH